MQFIFLIAVLLVFDGMLLWYLINSQYFLPYLPSGEVDVWNVLLFVVMLSAAISLTVMLLVYLGEKLLYCGKKEFPPMRRAVRIGLTIFIIVTAGLVLHVFHLLHTFVVVILCALALIGIIIVR